MTDERKKALQNVWRKVHDKLMELDLDGVQNTRIFVDREELEVLYLAICDYAENNKEQKL